ncbi:metallophosphoesterase [Rhizobium sp. Leaf321]|uniref:metallophosphoesterase n=1 Tax=Rhizobium sp. Leaf321 TaxID=1736335 RepID=UPI000AD549D7|nr:metallophosphoesterase [Rhizobium sp. Leaf321]
MSFTQKFYSADLHLGHAAILKSCASTRPFATAVEMDAAIVDNINARVRGGDILYILGDFTLSRNAEYVRHLFHTIRPRKILILGNHDVDNRGAVKKTISELPWDCPPVGALETKDGGRRLWLSHYAHRTWPAMHHGSYHFFGHSHGNLKGYGRSRDVGIDVADTLFAPRTFQELIATMPDDSEAEWHSHLVRQYGRRVPPVGEIRVPEQMRPLIEEMFARLSVLLPDERLSTVQDIDFQNGVRVDLMLSWVLPANVAAQAHALVDEIQSRAGDQV